jgi:hypothetical protein
LRAYDNSELRTVCGPKREEATGDCRKLNNEELKILYSSPCITKVIKLMRIRRARYIEHLGDLGIYGRIILKWILKIGCEDMEWLHLIQERDQWRVPMKTLP